MANDRSGRSPLGTKQAESASGSAAKLTQLAGALQSLRDQSGSALDDGGIPSEQLTRLLEISRAMNGIHDRFELFSYVEDRLRELFDAENSFVILFAEDGTPEIQSAHLLGRTSHDDGEAIPNQQP